jgi:hypothetical protein
MIRTRSRAGSWEGDEGCDLHDSTLSLLVSCRYELLMSRVGGGLLTARTSKISLVDQGK